MYCWHERGLHDFYMTNYLTECFLVPFIILSSIILNKKSNFVGRGIYPAVTYSHVFKYQPEPIYIANIVLDFEVVDIMQTYCQTVNISNITSMAGSMLLISVTISHWPIPIPIQGWKPWQECLDLDWLLGYEAGTASVVHFPCKLDVRNYSPIT